jgi:SAM-dependent methyltransferase
MRDHWQDLLKRLDWQEGQSIIDIGGAMDPVPIADEVVDIVNLGRGGKHYTILDLCADTLPFPDNAFDICVCSNTLEDLGSPALILREMSRVAKRGIIDVPHRGPESLMNTHYDGYPKPSYAMSPVWCFGTEHHKWLIEEIDGVLCLVVKNQRALSMYPIPEWRGPSHVSFAWENSIPHETLYDVDMDVINRNYQDFRDNNREFWSS